MVRLANTLTTAIWIARSLEDMIKGRTTTQADVEENRINEGSSKSNKRYKISKPNPNNEKTGCYKDPKWCEKCKKDAYWTMQERCALLQVWNSWTLCQRMKMHQEGMLWVYIRRTCSEGLPKEGRSCSSIWNDSQDNERGSKSYFREPMEGSSLSKVSKE